MDLSAPLATLIPSLDAGTLAALAATEGTLGVSQIARIAGRGSRAGHLNVLQRLVEHGLVVAEPASQGFQYRLNREHLLCPSVLEALAVRRVLFERLTARCVLLDPRPIHVSVFGSFARGEAGPTSDIDLLAVVADDQVDALTDAFADVTEAVRRWTGNPCQVVVVGSTHLAELAGRGSAIVAAWHREHILVTGAPFGALIGTADPDA
jgi:predicted nucleotidyltransferase